MDEVVALGVYSPGVLDPASGLITPEGFPTGRLIERDPVDDCGNSSGISVARVNFEPAAAELRETIQQIVEKPRKDGVAKVAIGYATIAVERLAIDGIVTLDDGWEQYTTHAVLRSGRSKGELKGIRDTILTELNRSLVRW